MKHQQHPKDRRITEAASRPRVRQVAKAVLAVLIGILIGAGFNAMLGDQGADTPALALVGGGVALLIVLLQARR